MSYTDNQKDLIRHLLGTRIAPHTKSPSLRMSLLKTTERMYDDALTESNLILLNSALELVVTNTLEDGSKESWTELVKKLFHEAIMFTTVFTGLRLGEVLGLTWDCIDFDNNLITVEKQHGRDRVTGEYVFSSIKNDQTRILTAAQEVMNVLKEHKRHQRQMAKEAGKEWSNPKNLVFTTETGRYIENKMLYMYFKRVVKKIGMSDMRFHDLRHTYAVNSLKAGDDIKTLQENLGHATASFTLSTYAHATPNMKQECSRRMDNFIQSVLIET